MANREGKTTRYIILIVLLAACAVCAVCKTSGVREPADLPLDDLDAAVDVEDGIDADAGEVDDQAENQDTDGGEDEDDGGAENQEAGGGEDEDDHDQPGIDLRDM